VREKKNDPGVLLLVLIALLLAAGAAAAVYGLRSDPVEEALSGDRVINVLYVIEKDEKPFSTYVLMYYPATKRAAIFDIPGDLGLLLKRINRVDRIDTAYQSEKIAGFETEIEGLLGIEISYSVVMTLENLGKMVDLLEGVELFIPSVVDLRTEEGVVRFPSGVTRLDGDKAVSYICYAAGEEDREMMVFRRQRFFLGFLKRQAAMSGQLKNAAVAKLYQSFFETNMTRRTRMRFIDEFAYIDTDRTGIQTVGGNLREVSGQMLLIPFYDGSLVKEIVRQTLTGLTRQSEGSSADRVFTVEVLNGTAISGLAGRTAELLRGFGYDVISIGNADRNSYEKTEIVDRSGNAEIAKNFAGIIRCGNIREEAPLQDNPEAEFSMQSYEYRSDFSLIIGRDFNGRYVTGN
jgi:anionic cell wall polymer biosynthesis LytR-Cps2A-Psr (LCP) family protein